MIEKIPNTTNILKFCIHTEVNTDFFVTFTATVGLNVSDETFTRNFLWITLFLCYLVDAVDLFGRVDHKTTPGTGLHDESVSLSPKNLQEKISEDRNWCENGRESQFGQAVSSLGTVSRLPDSLDSVSLLVVNLALCPANFETLSYLTACPMMDQPPLLHHGGGTGWDQLSVCLEERERQRVQMSLHMCHDPELDSWFIASWHSDIKA